MYKFRKLTSYEDYITDVLVSIKFKYLVTATTSGQVILWKLGNKKELIHTFESQRKLVSSLQEIPGLPSLFLAASNDCSIRLFDLEKCLELYRVNLPAGVTNIQLLSHKQFVCSYNSQISVGSLNLLLRNFLTSQVNVVQIQRLKHKDGQHLMMSLMEDNSVAIQCNDFDNPVQLSTVYPPPGAKEVVFIDYSQSANLITLLLANGNICLYFFEGKEVSCLTQMTELHEIKDRLNRKLTQKITSITLGSVTPPKFDSEILSTSNVI